MQILIVVFIIIALMGLTGIIYILLYNKFQNNIIRINEAENEIDETLRKRYDILVNVENYINVNTGLEQDNFKDFNSESKISNFDADRKLTKILETFETIISDFEKELNTVEIKEMITELKINTEKIDASKSYYNKYTTKLNYLIRKFPTNLIARIHGINERNYFDNKNLNDDDILDFKI